MSDDRRIRGIGQPW